MAFDVYGVGNSLVDIQARVDDRFLESIGFQKGIMTLVDEAAQRRFWKIDGFAEVPCGGTHVKSTVEVGYVSLKRKNIGGGKERIEITLNEPDRLTIGA